MEDRGKHVLDFLREPVLTGSYYQRIIIDGTLINGFWKFLRDYSKKKRVRFKIEEPTLDFDMDLIGDVGKWWLTQSMEEMLNFLIKLDICPSQIKKWSSYGVTVLVPEYVEEEETEPQNYFLSPRAYAPENLEAFSIEIEPGAYPNLVIDIMSLTSAALQEFRQFIVSIPVIGKGALFTKEQKKHAEKYVSVLYPSVAALWIDNLASLAISGDLVDLFTGALEYFYRREWRTSILLSAISLEKQVAELYEETFKKPCPPFSLGAVSKKISDLKPLPKNIDRVLRMTNSLRIAAVHRSYMPLGVKEATDALSGSLRFLLWFLENSSDFCSSSK